MLFYVSHDHVICDCDICDHPVTGVMYLSYFVTYVIIIHDIILYILFKFKIKKNTKSIVHNSNTYPKVYMLSIRLICYCYTI